MAQQSVYARGLPLRQTAAFPLGGIPQWLRPGVRSFRAGGI